MPRTYPRAGHTRHYATLDLLRGVAAIAVAAFHLGIAVGPFHVGSAYLAVDFFFVLSGFVIAHAYDRRLGATMDTGAFFVTRVVRLFPLYLAGTLLAAAAICVVVLASHDARHWTPESLLVAVLLGAVMLPSPFAAALFPLNDPAWSLFFEALVNVAYGARLWQGDRLIRLVTGLAAVGLLAEGIVCGSLDHGATWGDQGWWTLLWAGLRVAYSFPLGVLLYRHRDRLPPLRVPLAVLALLLAILLCADPDGALRCVFDLVFVLAVSPAFVVVGCGSQPAAGRQALVCGVLGSISYPLYVLHRPIMSLIEGAGRRITHSDAALWPQRPWLGVIVLVVLILFAAVADKADQAFRRVLLMRVLPSRSRRSPA